MKEEWKFYKETYNCRWGKRVYEVSDQGNVKINGVLIDFSKQGRYYGIADDYLHRIVAELFVPNPDNKPEVDHINRDTHDNRAINLRWVTHAENMKNTPDTHGENNPMYGYVYSDEQRKAMSERNKKRMQDPNERKKCGRSGVTHHNYGKHLSKSQTEKQSKSIKEHYNDPINREKQSNIMKEYYATHSSSIKKGSKQMTDGYIKLYVEPEYWGEFIDIGFIFVRK